MRGSIFYTLISLLHLVTCEMFLKNRVGQRSFGLNQGSSRMQRFEEGLFAWQQKDKQSSFKNEQRLWIDNSPKKDTVFIQSLSCVQLFATPWTAASQASLSFTISWSLLKLMPIESMMSSNRLILCCPLLLLISIFPNIMVFSNESALHIGWPKHWSFSNSSSNDYSGLISFRIDWFDLAVQQTLKSFLRQHSSKASILWRLAFFIVQL